MPWFITPFVVPSFLLLAASSLVFRIDIFTDAANVSVVNTLSIITTALVTGLYGAILALVWARHRSVR